MNAMVHKMYIVRRLLLAILTVVLVSSVQADVAVIVHPENAYPLNRNQIRLLYIGAMTELPNGDQPIILSLSSSSSAAMSEFYKKVLQRTPKQMKAYWGKMVFTGRGTPPIEVTTVESMIRMVSENPSAVGFIPSEFISERVKVVDLVR